MTFFAGLVFGNPKTSLTEPLRDQKERDFELAVEKAQAKAKKEFAKRVAKGTLSNGQGNMMSHQIKVDSYFAL